MAHDRPTLSSALCYRDAAAAIEFLQQAFGFEPLMIIRDPGGSVVHSELTLGDGVIMVGGEWNESTRSPANIDGKNTQTIHVHLTEDIDAHCARARAAGAEIVAAPEDQFYGDRTYRARDPEGHIWTFGQTKKAMRAKDWDAVGGVKTWVRPGSGYD
jgi:uncharacterized glyoxalase superfamily protein PhnB